MFEIVPRGYRVYPGADIQIPKRATPHSAGYDFYTPTDLIIPPRSSSFLVFTDVRVKLKPNQFLALYPRSSMGIKKGLQLSNTVGIIDSDYYNNQETGGNIAFKFYNHSTECVEIKMGEKIMQGIVQEYHIFPTEISPTDSRVGGFGSTDK